MVLRSLDVEVLDAISAIEVPVVRLQRIVEERYESTPGLVSATLSLQDADPFLSRMYPDLVDDVQTATWWHQSQEHDPSTSDHTRVLRGEIHLAYSLRPSCELGYFKNSVRIPILKDL